MSGALCVNQASLKLTETHLHLLLEYCVPPRLVPSSSSPHPHIFIGLFELSLLFYYCCG